jgi:hypothetical protein
MSVDLVHPAVEKVTLVLEGIGAGKVRVNSASLAAYDMESNRRFFFAIRGTELESGGDHWDCV